MSCGHLRSRRAPRPYKAYPRCPRAQADLGLYVYILIYSLPIQTQHNAHTAPHARNYLLTGARRCDAQSVHISDCACNLSADAVKSKACTGRKGPSCGGSLQFPIGPRADCNRPRQSSAKPRLRVGHVPANGPWISRIFFGGKLGAARGRLSLVRVYRFPMISL